jgi:hypothetical protein
MFLYNIRMKNTRGFLIKVPSHRRGTGFEAAFWLDLGECGFYTAIEKETNRRGYQSYELRLYT